MKRSRMTLIMGAALLIASCGGEKENPEESAASKEIGEGYSEEDRAYSDSVAAEINMLIQMVPSPVEMASALHHAGADFNDALLNSTDKLTSYSTSHQKAVALGVYGADLGYINLYHETIRSLDYIGSIVQLSKDLKVSQFFDFSTLKRLASEHDDLDSLLMITTTGFSNMNNYLRNQDRSNVSALIAMGAWTEGMYIMSQTYLDTEDEQLGEKMAEQKMLIPEFAKIIEAFPDLEFHDEFTDALSQLESSYSNIQMDLGGGEVIMKEVDGEVVFEQKDESTIEFTPETMQQIAEIISELRSQITKK